MKLGTRGSQLALWQAHTVARLLLERSGITCDIVTIRTSGDERSSAADAALRAPAGDATFQIEDTTKRVFVKEIEDALLDGRIDLAVHSAKDMSAEQLDGLAIAAALPREDPHDVLVLPSTAAAVADLDAVRAHLGAAPRLGTSSIRRSAQLRRLFPQATFDAVRGNVDTRLRKLDTGVCDALVLASAGLRRLGLANRISFTLPAEHCTPAPGQGIVAVQIRRDDDAVRTAVAAITDRDAADALAAEQALVRTLGGGCSLPVGAFARITAETLSLAAIVISPDGVRVVRETRRGARQDAVAIGDAVAASLLANGAGEILRAVNAE